ncbi:MAG: glycosyltransferase family 4 protein [Balneolaceae bacterium]|nr:glycosyltransferase family 4 protein [Balneolaceae bacterium]
MPNAKTLLIIGKVWPEPRSSAAGSRMIQLIQLFKKDGWEITFSSSAAKSDYSFDLEKIGVHEEPVQLNESSFDDFVLDINPQAVLFDRYMTEEQFGWRVAENCPDALRILDTEDLHCLRNARQNAWRESKKFEIEDLFTEETAKREIASILRCDLSLIISDVEVQILKEAFHINESLIFYLPFLLDTEKETEPEKLLSFEDRNAFVSIGNFRHEPNWNAVLWLKDELWPLIREKLPSAKLYLYGSYPTKKTFQLSNPDDGFLIKGRASDAKEVIGKARVLLAPLRFGAGLKGKLVDAMQCGTPSVTTSIGAEGIVLGSKWNGVIADKSRQFADAAVELYQNFDFWQTSQKAGFELLKKRFSRNKFAPAILAYIEEVSENLEQHREKNFTGSMLMHHTMNSTKFMSKWIEEKNKT